MKKYVQLIIALLATVTAIGQKLSPTVVASSGGYSTAGGVSLSFTIGQPAGATFTVGGITLTQGFQQPGGKISYGPVIKSFSPNTGKKGTVVTIIGKFFTASSPLSVSFGGVPATAIQVRNDTTILATVGSGATGNVVVTTPGGTASLGVFGYCAAPVEKDTTISACNSVVYKGVTYTSSATKRDTVRSIFGCDSIYNVANIVITRIVPVTINLPPLYNCTMVTYAGKVYTVSTQFTVKTLSRQGCDSVYTVVTIIIANPPVTITKPYTGCGQYVYNGKTYTTSTVVTDTVHGYKGCDSIYNVAVITINPKPNLGKDTGVSVCAGSTANITGFYKTAGYATVMWSVTNPAAAGPGKDSLFVTTSAGCTDTAVVTITALPLPVMPATVKTGSTSFCINDSLVLTNTTTGKLQWLRNGNAIKNATAAKYVVRVAGIYKLKVTGANSCAAVSADSVVATVIQPPAPVITLFNDTLFSSATAGNQWYFSGFVIPGATAYKYAPNDVGFYTVKAITGGCGTPMSAPYMYTAGTKAFKGIGNAIARASIYPNPAQSTANLQLSGFAGKVTVTVTDLAGKVVWQQDKLTNSTYTLPLSSLASGVYMVTVKDKTGMVSLKLVKAQ